MTPDEFIAKWSASELKESQASQSHFNDLCRMLGEPTPIEADPTGESYCFERGAQKDSGGDGWADVWKRGHFGWEYKGPHANLDTAFRQLRQYTLALDNPPLLIVCDLQRFRIRTNWTNSVSETHEFVLEDLRDAATRNKLKWALSDPERLRPGETRQEITERAAQRFATLAQSLRDRGNEPQAVAHFVNRLVFCMFAEDVGLLPNNLFTRMLEQAIRRPPDFPDLARDLFGAMSVGGRVGFESVAWFDGGLFDDDSALPLTQRRDRDRAQRGGAGLVGGRPVHPGHAVRTRIGPRQAHAVGGALHRPRQDHADRRAGHRPPLAGGMGDHQEPDRRGARLRRSGPAAREGRRGSRRNPPTGDRAERLLHDFLERLRAFTVLDPACGSGNFLYLALQALKDLEHRVQLESAALGLDRQFPTIGPANVKGIEINPYAAELARVSVWIGEIQWMQRNGFAEARDPILQPLDTIECRDAVLTPDGKEPDWPEADVVIGNPPFLGNRRMRRELGDDVAEALPTVYAEWVRGKPDLVCYWFAKAGRLVAEGKVQRAGLVATNSIRGGTNRSALDRIVKDRARSSTPGRTSHGWWKARPCAYR